MFRLVKSNQPLLKKVARLSGPEVQIITGAVLAMLRNRDSLCRRDFSVFRCCSINTESDRIGTPVTIRKSCRERILAASEGKWEPGATAPVAAIESRLMVAS